MGFFGDLFNSVTENLSSMSEKAEEEQKKIVNQLKNDSRIFGNPVIENVLEEYQEYEKIGFGIDSAADKEKLYETFQICRDETVVAVVSGKGNTFSFSKADRVVITNKALYTHPSIVKEVEDNKAQLIHCDNKTNRFLIEDFCKYILYAPLKYNVIMFKNYEGTFILDRKSIIKGVLSKNQEEVALYNMIKKMQQKLYETSEKSKNDRSKTLEWLSEKAEKEILSGKMEDDTATLVEQLEKEEVNKVKWIGLLLKNALYLYDRNLLSKWASKVASNITFDDEKKILEEFRKNCDKLIENLKNPERLYNEELLKYIQIEKSFFKERGGESTILDTTFKEQLLGIFDENKQKLGTYMALWKYPETELKNIEAYLEENNWKLSEKDTVLQLVLCIRNRRMKLIYETIRKNEKFDKKWIEWTDGFGLTPLHYAILLNNRQKVEEITELLLNSKHSKNLSDEISDIYDYGVLCVLADKMDYINDVAVFSREMHPLIENRKKLQVILKIKKAAYNAQKRSVSNMDAAYRRARNAGKYDEEQLERGEQKLREAKESLYRFEIDIDALERDIEENEDEIYRMGRALISKYSEVARRIQNGKSLLEKVIRWLYSSPEALYEVLNIQISESRLYRNEGLYFNIPKKMFEDEQKQGSSSEGKQYQERREKKKQGTASQQKRYGNHWFSPEAYADINVLRKEYHILAAKYHPDNNPDGAEIFLEIQEERSTILDMLEE